MQIFAAQNRVSSAFFGYNKHKTERLVLYIIECIQDSVNKRIYITSAYAKKGSTDQLLDMDSNKSPQPTPEASFDGSATNSSISQPEGKVNSKIAEKCLDNKKRAAHFSTVRCASPGPNVQ